MVVIIVLFGVLLTAKPAHAKTFTVGGTFDGGGDVNLADDKCDAHPDPFVPTCALRAAIQQANATNGADTIDFHIVLTSVGCNPSTGACTIEPISALSTISEAAIIDGYSQPEASPNTKAQGTDAKLKIELDGSDAGQFSVGLDIRAANSMVRGLVIDRFFDGIRIRAASGCKVQGNFIGTDPGGTIDRGNSAHGVIVGSDCTYASNNIIGGTSPKARNLISGNGSAGASIQDNSFSGVSTDNAVRGNLIGTKKDGISALGNSKSGVYILGASDNTVGGGRSAAANTIAFNGRDGVRVVSVSNDGIVPTGIRILRNSIHSNSLPGIDLKGGTETIVGHTQNDPQDADTGPNGLQNHPGLTSATTSGGTTTIKGELNSTPNKTFTPRFFSNPSGDEGAQFIGKKSVSTNQNGNDSFSFSPAEAVPDGQSVTATATNQGGNTSEFSGFESVT